MFTVTMKSWKNLAIEVAALGYVKSAEQVVALVYANIKNNDHTLAIYFGRTKVATVPDVESNQLLRLIRDLPRPLLVTLAIGDENNSAVCVEAQQKQERVSPDFVRLARCVGAP